MNRIRKYCSGMRAALCSRGHLLDPESMYYGIEGHRRLARETGYALNDFTAEERIELLRTSYRNIYMPGCSLHPLLDEKEWVGILESQIK